jgi:hypothetical protein
LQIFWNWEDGNYPIGNCNFKVSRLHVYVITDNNNGLVICWWEDMNQKNMSKAKGRDDDIYYLHLYKANRILKIMFQVDLWVLKIQVVLTNSVFHKLFLSSQCLLIWDILLRVLHHSMFEFWIRRHGRGFLFLSLKWSNNTRHYYFLNWLMIFLLIEKFKKTWSKPSASSRVLDVNLVWQSSRSAVVKILTCTFVENWKLHRKLESMLNIFSYRALLLNMSWFLR